MNCKHLWSPCIFLMWMLPAAAESEPEVALGIDDFAYSMPIETTASGAIHTTTLPLEVYQGLTRRNRGDLRVFDASGKPVPHALRTLNKDRTVRADAHRLPLFPLRSDKPTDPTENLTMIIKRSDAGDVLSVTAAESKSVPTDQQRVVGLVADASALTHPIEALQFRLESTEESFVLPIQIDVSDDLGDWRRIQSIRPLVQLQYDQQRIQQLRVDVPPIKEPFLRISWGHRALPTNIIEIQAELQAGRISAQPQSVQIPGTPDPEHAHRVSYDLSSSAMRVDRISVVIPEKNTLMQGTLSTSQKAQGPFQEVHSGTFFHVMHEGAEVRSPPVSVSRSNGKRYWQLEVDSKTGALTQPLPSLHMAYFPDQLLFLAKGQGPYTLAYGSYRAKPAEFPVKEILAALPTDARDALPISNATLGPQAVRAGPSARIAPPPPPESQLPKMALWGILIGGVVILGVFVRKLAMDVEDTPKGS